MHQNWYIAELLEEFRSENQLTSLLHINWILVRANNAEEAYSKSIEFGQDLNRAYRNTEDILVTVTFRGLRDLNIIHEPLEDGAEILFEEIEEMSNNEIKSMIASKNDLSAFKPPNI